MKKKFIPLVILVSLALAFFHPFILNGKLPIPSDTIVGLYHPYRDLYAGEYPRGVPFKNFQITDPVRQQYPWKSLAIETWKKFQFPLWNPYNFTGTPLLANFQSAVFYPFNFILFFLPFDIGWSILILIQPLLAMVFMYLYLRNLRISIPAGIFGSLAFGFCGFFVSWMEWGNIVHTGLWLPLILLATDKIVTKGEKRIFVWHSVLFLSLLVSFFAGHLQVFFYESVIVIFYFVFRWVINERKKNSFIYFILTFGILAIPISIQAIPLFQLISLSARNVDQVSTNVPGWYIPWQNLTQFIAPDFFGNPSTLNYWGVWNYGEFIGYVGLFPLILALYAIFFKRDKTVFFFSLVMLAGLLFALPTIFAKIPFKFDLPFLSTSQPTRLLFLVDVSLSILAAYGLDYFLKTKKKIFVPLALICSVLAGFWSFVILNQSLPTFFHVTPVDLAVTKNNLKLPSVLFIVFTLIIVQFIYFEKKLKFAKNLFLIIILIITAFDLYRFSSKYLTFADKQYLFPQTKILSYLQKDKEPFRVMANDSRIFPSNFSIMYKISTLDGYDPLFLRRYAELAAAIARDKPDINPPFGFNRIVTLQHPKSDIVNILNVKYVLSLNEIDSPKFKEVMREGETILYKNQQFIPRAFFVSTTITASDKQDAINKIFENSKKLKKIAIIENSDFESIKNWKVGNAMIEVNEENKIIINTKNQGKGFLVLADSYYPTWRAEIDGKEAKIYLTNYNFRGIIIPKGNHKIRFYNNFF